MRAAVSVRPLPCGWVRLEVDDSVYGGGVRLPYCLKADGSQPYLPLAAVGPEAQTRVCWLDAPGDDGPRWTPTSFLAAARLRSPLVEFAQRTVSAEVAPPVEPRQRAAAPRVGGAPELVEWLNARLQGQRLAAGLECGTEDRPRQWFPGRHVWNRLRVLPAAAGRALGRSEGVLLGQ